MSIHSAIKALRLRKNWSHATLGAEVAKAEGLPRPLAWQTVQQWEREGGTAPKRKRLEYAAQVLDTTTERLMAGNPEPLGPALADAAARPPAAPAPISLRDALPVVLAALASLPPLRWQAVRSQLDQVNAHPEIVDDAFPEVLHQLSAAPAKRQVGV